MDQGEQNLPLFFEKLHRRLFIKGMPVSAEAQNILIIPASLRGFSIQMACWGGRTNPPSPQILSSIKPGYTNRQEGGGEKPKCEWKSSQA